MAEKRFDIDRYRRTMAGYIGAPGPANRVFWEALDFSLRSHEGQFRRSGEPYIAHPCQVALILAEELDIREPEILAAALLHDTIEDVPEVTAEVVGELFGKTVEELVDGCTKINHSTKDRQTFYKLVHRKLFSGAAARIEVMLIKLADRLHNLRTLDALPRHKRQKIADETLDIYAPLARVMGLFNIKRELYDLALIYKFPRQGHKLESRIRQLEQAPEVQEIAETLRTELQKLWIDCQISVRAKGLWAYYDAAEKTLAQQIQRPVELILVVQDIQTCYRVLGVLNQNYPPIPRTIRDFIANPKPTGYQGLHAKANIKGTSFLFKIRTHDMELRNQRGLIKGWSSAAGFVSDSFERDLQEMFDILGTDDDLSHKDMIAASGRKEIYTYTPKGDRVILPRNSVVLDFAYQVHTAIGDRCIGAAIGSRRVGPEQVLRDGDQVKIIRQNEPVLFDPYLQELCQTPRARAGLAKGFRRRRQRLAVEIGRSLLEQELKRNGVPRELVDDEGFERVWEKFDLGSATELFLGIGSGAVHLRQVVYAVIDLLRGGERILQPPTGVFNRFDFSSLDPASIKFSACCKPLPTDTGILGLLSERGLSVHRKECKRLAGLRLQREDVVELHWRLKDTAIRKPQSLLVHDTTRNRLLMLLAVAPEQMKVSEIISLPLKTPLRSDWEINFELPNLHVLKAILQHLSKAGLSYEFVLEQ